MTKELILSEIRRAAKEVGGETLGRIKFSKITGIKDHEWMGKFWARWTDAVTEAGFRPREMQKAYSDEEILHPFASYVSQLNRFPSHMEMRLKRRNDPDFPSHNTLAKFGQKKDLAATTAAFCKARGCFPDVIPNCETAILQEEAPSLARENATEELDFGEVYLVKSGKFYKIGRSNNAGRRHYELSIQLPEAAKIVHTIRTDDPPGIKAYWHHRFKAKRKNGEWFELNSGDISAFRRRKFT
jgi:Meiotically up-regulated gene 113